MILDVQILRLKSTQTILRGAFKVKVKVDCRTVGSLISTEAHVSIKF